MNRVLVKSLNKSMYVPFVEIFAKGISFINVLIFIRILSVNDYAIYSYALSVVLWASVLMDGGISNLIYKKSLNKDTSNINSFFFARIFLSILIIFLLIILIILKNPEYVWVVLITSFIILFSSTSSLLKMFARGNGYTDADMLAILSEPVIRLVFLIFILLTINIFNWNLYQVLSVYLVAGILAFIINYIKLKKYFRFVLVNNRTNNFFDLIKRLYNESKFYLLYYLMVVGISRIDIIYIEQYGFKKDLAVFSTAINLYQVVQLFFFALISSQFLTLLKWRKLFFKYLIPSLIVVSVLLLFISRYIYILLFPKDYQEGYVIFNSIIIALLPSVLNYYMITKNNYLNRVKINFIILSLFLALKISLYSLFQSQNLYIYYTIFPIIEFGILLTLLTYNKFYANPSDQ